MHRASKVVSVPTFNDVSHDHVLQAIAEYDERGADDFLEHYGFGSVREHLLWHEEKSYDAKAILGVAHQYATGDLAGSDEVRGGEDGAAKTLREIGFDVSADEAIDPDAPAAKAWRDISEVGVDAAHTEWAEAAREVLLVTASRYHAVISSKEVATEVQERTGIRTKQLMHHWIGSVLGKVSATCAANDEPLLPSLCVNTAGSVGDAYAVAVGAATGEKPDDGDDHAAQERLKCYRHFGANDLPSDGGVPALTRKLAATRGRARQTLAAERPVPLCPTCHTQVPGTGICDFCD